MAGSKKKKKKKKKNLKKNFFLLGIVKSVEIGLNNLMANIGSQ